MLLVSTTSSSEAASMSKTTSVLFGFDAEFRVLSVVITLTDFPGDAHRNPQTCGSSLGDRESDAPLQSSQDTSENRSMPLPAIAIAGGVL